MNKIFFSTLRLEAKKSYVSTQIVSARSLFAQVSEFPEFAVEIKRIIADTQELLVDEASDFIFEKETLIALNLYLLYLEQKINPHQLQISSELNYRLGQILSDQEKRQTPVTAGEDWQKLISNSHEPINAKQLLIFIYHEINLYSATLIQKCVTDLAVADFDFEKLSEIMTVIENNETIILESERHQVLEIKMACRKKLANLLFLRIKEDVDLLSVPFSESKVQELKDAYAFLLEECAVFLEYDKSRAIVLNDDTKFMQSLFDFSLRAEGYMTFFHLAHGNVDTSFYKKSIKEKIDSFCPGVRFESITDISIINEILPYLYLKALFYYSLAGTAKDCESASANIDEFMKLVNLYELLIAKSLLASQIYAAHLQSLQVLKTAVICDAPPSRKFSYHVKEYEAAKNTGDHQKVIELGNMLMGCLRQMDPSKALPPKHSVSSFYIDIADAHTKLGQLDLAIENMTCAYRRGPLSVDDQSKLLKLIQQQLEKNPCNHRTAFLNQCLKEFRVRVSPSVGAAPTTLFNQQATNLTQSSSSVPVSAPSNQNGSSSHLSGKKHEREPTPTW